MARYESEDEDTPLLPLVRFKLGNASAARTFGNIIVSIVGTGVLGLPYTFRVSGWASGTIAVVISAILTYYCMLLLVSSRNKLEEEGHTDIVTYGDLGHHAFGSVGQAFVDAMVLVSQSGCCVAYLIFIGQNLSSIFATTTDRQDLFILILLPMEIVMSCVRSLSGLAPFSILADICNVLAMGVVLRDDFGSFQGFNGIVAFQGWSGVPFAFGVAVFAYEGFGMTLALESSMKRPRCFPRVLAQAFLPITFLYITFGIVGYVAFRDSTMDIITLNLPNGWSTIVVKVGLCIALAFTFPVMMFPVHELVENKLAGCTCFQKQFARHPVLGRLLLDAARGMLVLLVAAIALMVPSFSVFISFVGSTVCAMMAFVFPSSFHLRVFKGCLQTWQWIFDVVLIGAGLAFAIYTTYLTCLDSLS